MGVIQSGASSDLLTIDPTFKAARVSIRPPEMLGGYRIGMKTGNIAAGTAAGGIMAAFRNPSSSNVAVVTSVRIGLNIITAYTAGSIQFGLWFTRSYTATETTAYTAATLTTNNQKLRTSHATTGILFGVATTTTISGGTGADDSQPMAAVTFNLPNTITGQPVQDFFNYHIYSHPMVFAQNEGFRIRNDTAFAATGVSNVVVSVEWYEVANGNY